MCFDFTDQLTTQDRNSLGVDSMSFQLLYNLAVSIDSNLRNLKANKHAFSAGETYRTCITEISLFANVFPEESFEKQIVLDMFKQVSEFSNVV